MTAESITLEGAIVLEGGDRHRHAARRLRESFPGIDWRDGGAGAAVTLMDDPSLPEGAFRIEAEAAADQPSRAAPSPASSTAPRSSSLAAGRIPDASRSRQGVPSRRRPAWRIAPSGPGTTRRTGSSPRWASRRSASSIPMASRPAASCGTTSAASTSARGIASRPSSSTASCATPTVASRLPRSCARYATERGVRILPGIAIGSYGGCYWEGDHRFNLATWLKAHPQHAATLEKGVGFQIADLAFPLELPQVGLHPLRLPLGARDDGLDGGGCGLAGRDLRAGRHQHRGR